MATILPDNEKKKKKKPGVMTPPTSNLGLDAGARAVSPAPLPPAPAMPPNIAEMALADRAAQQAQGAVQGGDGGVGVDKMKNKIVRSRAGLTKGMI
jgi:hypothetical protein